MRAFLHLGDAVLVLMVVQKTALILALPERLPALYIVRVEADVCTNLCARGRLTETIVTVDGFDCFESRVGCALPQLCLFKRVDAVLAHVVVRERLQVLCLLNAFKLFY